MPSFNRHQDARVRAAAFEWLGDQVAMHGDVLPRDVIAQGFTLDGDRVPLVGPQGIFKPRVMDVPISITTAPKGPYDDTFGPGDLLYYKYRGTDPEHRDNAGLVFAMKEELPLVYFCAAFDRRFVGVTPDYEIRVRPDILDEEDGPTLVHGIQALEGEHIALPRKADDRPDPERLERRWVEFQEGLGRAV